MCFKDSQLIIPQRPNLISYITFNIEPQIDT
jgi:hypothetical protein